MPKMKTVRTAIYAVFCFIFIANSTHFLRQDGANNNHSCNADSYRPTVIDIQCTNYTEYEVDQIILERYPNKSARICLQYEYVQFENSTLKKHWYKGIYNISMIVFEGCVINCIESDAFNVAALARLVLIRFYFVDGVVTLAPLSFNGLKGLKQIGFETTKVNELHKDILQPFNNTLESFVCGPLKQNFSISDFFGGTKSFDRMRELSLSDVVSTEFTTLASNNFSKLSKLLHLNLVNCGIELISEHTFDSVAQTLRTLFLSQNNLQILTAVLRIFVGRFQNINALVWAADRNRLVCNCDYYLLENVTMMAMKGPINLGSRPNCNQNLTANCDNMCPSMQLVHIQKMCLTLTNLDRFSYPIFRISFDRHDNSIRVRTNVTETYKIIIESVKLRRKCNDKWWRMEYIKCIALNETNVEIPTSNWFPPGLVKISIGYMVHGWPLSFVTIRVVHENGYAFNSTKFLLLAIFLNILAFGAGFAVTICREHKRKQRIEVNIEIEINENNFEGETYYEQIEI